MAGAGGLANLYGTEKDRVNCPFYFKTGACRHGEKCTRLHNKPVISQTIMLPHMYLNPVALPMVDETGKPIEYDKKYLREHFEDFYEDTFQELMNLGEIKELNVVNNVCEHLLGNVYVKFATEDDAENAHKKLVGRLYAGRVLAPEFVPVTDFRESSCRQYEEDECGRGGLCNFMHLKGVSKSLLRELFSEQKKRYKERRREKRRREKDDKEPDAKRPKEEGGEEEEEEVFGLGKSAVNKDRETSEERRERLRSAFEKKHGRQEWD
ncbi:Splicing factor U2af small subunit B [Diplonema papillatum]|nr:Splicing factor U2af small subunit B [Diplonema papillatum]WGM49963.1 U2AF35 [Diplonema papillatum]|eukprot:gene7223-11118_t